MTLSQVRFGCFCKHCFQSSQIKKCVWADQLGLNGLWVIDNFYSLVFKYLHFTLYCLLCCLTWKISDCTMIGFGRFSHFNISTNLSSSLKNDVPADASFLLPVFQEIPASFGVWVIVLLLFILVVVRVVGLFQFLQSLVNYKPWFYFIRIFPYLFI